MKQWHSVVLLGTGIMLLAVRGVTQPPTGQGNAGQQAVNPTLHANKVIDPTLDGVPLAKGWPLALPGPVTGTPVVADLDGDGAEEIIVPVMTPFRAMPGLLNQQPSTDAQLWAFHANGTLVKGWPVVLVATEERKLAQKSNPNNFEDWASSPSVLELPAGDNIVINAPDSGDWRRSVWRVSSKGALLRLSLFSDPWASAPIADINGDGEMDVVSGRTLATINGEPVLGWPEARIIPGGWAPTIGDANGDGKLEVYHPDYATAYHLNPPQPQGTISGLDRTGKALPGWPIRVGGSSMHVIMGDVSGDAAQEIICVDARNLLHVWTWDGKPAPGTDADGEWTAVLKNGVGARYAPPTLADLDGDGKAEIMLYDRNKRALMAWKGDGTGVFNEDGSVCRVPGVLAVPGPGVTVADLSGDGVWDIFCGTVWIKLARDGKTEITPLLPLPATVASHVTICDPDGDEKADLLFGLTDGRVMLYNTGLGYDKKFMQWPTQAGNFQHTGVWRNPLKK